MSPFLRKVRTSSGATAVQIAVKEDGVRRIVEHLGSAHNKTELAAKSAVKLLVRNDRKTAWDLYHLIKLVVPPELAHITFSTDEGLLEISAPQVTKAAGLMAVAQFYGVPASDVVAFGDMPNDIEMLQWAGLGVAMGNADERVKVAADEITTSNDDFGVARVLERLFP